MVTFVLICTALRTDGCSYCVLDCGTAITHRSDSKPFLMSCLRFAFLLLCQVILCTKGSPSPSAAPAFFVPQLLHCGSAWSDGPQQCLSTIIQWPPTVLFVDVFNGLLFLPIYSHFLIISNVVVPISSPNRMYIYHFHSPLITWY